MKMQSNPMIPASNTGKRAIVIGGSLGGLFAGALLQRIGWQVDVYERSPADLDSRGGGIVLQPEVSEVFRRVNAEAGLRIRGVQSLRRTVFRPDGTIEDRRMAPQTQTSWSLIYTTMKSAFGLEHYHQGKTLVAVDQDTQTDQVTATFADGTSATGDLLIGADGNGSTVRRLVFPETGEPSYAGYLAWRGLIAEEDMPPEARAALHGDFGFASNPGSHILGYLVPGMNTDIRDGHRLYNWVWYRTADATALADIMTDRDGRNRGFAIPEGFVTDAWRDRVYADAERLLPPGFRDVVLATEQPFGQAIRDLRSARMVNGRVVLIGDAAFIPRPHTAASTSKAAANALALADALADQPDDIPGALARWEPAQLRLGERLYQQGTRAGNTLMFGHYSGVAA